MPLTRTSNRRAKKLDRTSRMFSHLPIGIAPAILMIFVYVSTFGLAGCALTASPGSGNTGSLKLTTASLPAAHAGQTYFETLAIAGGTAPFSWSVSAGNLPAGVTLGTNNGALTGTPSKTGSFNMTISVNDSSTPMQTTNKAYSMSVMGAVTPVSITTTSLASGQVGSAYSAALAVSGGTTPYSWSISSGALPGGVSLGQSNGTISGTPKASGQFNFTVMVTDSTSPIPQTGTQSFSLTIAASSAQPPSVTTASLPGGTLGSVYSTMLTASGGTTPYTWSLTSGALPSGLTLAASSGAISGTPTAAGNSQFTLEVKDSKNNTGTKALNISIVAGTAVLSITNAVLPAGTINQAYAATLQATGGTPTYTWSIFAGQLPAGLMLTASTGQITGTPTTSGQSSFTMKVTDSAATPHTATKPLVLTISNTNLDQYGGLIGLSAPGGGTGWWTTAKIDNHQFLINPLGNAFFMFGVWNIISDAHEFPPGSGSSYDSRVIAKYGDDNLTWGPQQVRRLQSWGFNTIGPYSVSWVSPTQSDNRWPGDGTQPVKEPMVGLINVSYYSMYNADNYGTAPVKDLIAGVKPGILGYYGGQFPDVFDPAFDAFTNGMAQAQIKPKANSPWVIGYMSADTDNMWGFGAGSEFTTTPAGQNSDHLGLIALITAPTQTSNSNAGKSGHSVTYTDTQVYTKTALSTFLQAKYVSIQALNTAWTSNYTTFSSAGGWAVGTGLMDESGTLNHAWLGKDTVGLSDFNADVRADLSAFLVQMSKQYFTVCRTRFKQAAPNALYFGVTNLGGWLAPPRKEILQGAGGLIDVLAAGMDPTNQAQVDFVATNFGDVPIIEWIGTTANADSSFSIYPNSNSIQTQTQRAAYYTGQVGSMWSIAATSTGSRPFVGLLWWDFSDMVSEQANWGIVDLFDNAYDGVEDQIATGKDQWGYPTGGEQQNYGNFVGQVANANASVYQSMQNLPH